MKIGIASDHGGFELKEKLKNQKGFADIEWIDFGTDSQESVDYPDYISKLAKAVQEDSVSKGIAICGSGIGADITANRFKKVRAALVHDKYGAEMCRKHNNANVLALGGRVTDAALAEQLVEIFLTTDFEGGRHTRRVEKLDELS